MHEQLRLNTCTLIPGNNGDLQLAVSGGRVIVDIQAADLDVEGKVRHSHSMLSLSYAAALALRDVIDDLAEPVDHRQTTLPAVWSPSTYTQPVAVPAHGRRKRIFA